MELFQITQSIAIASMPLLFAVVFHEVAHGWTANKLGDPTAALLGRLSLNPIKHIDLLGTIILPIAMLILGGFIFGWAKPVPINWQNLRNPRRDMALVAIAGPLANLLMALVWAGLAKSILLYTGADVNMSPLLYNSLRSCFFGVQINCILMLLNLLPVPPLDGSRLVSALLPANLAQQYEKIEPYGLWILLALIFLGALSYILTFPIQLIVGLIFTLVGISV